MRRLLRFVKLKFLFCLLSWSRRQLLALASIYRATVFCPSARFAVSPVQAKASVWSETFSRETFEKRSSLLSSVFNFRENFLVSRANFIRIPCCLSRLSEKKCFDFPIIFQSLQREREFKNFLTLFRPAVFGLLRRGVGGGEADSPPLRNSKNIRAMITTLGG